MPGHSEGWSLRGDLVNLLSRLNIALCREREGERREMRKGGMKEGKGKMKGEEGGVKERNQKGERERMGK